jgi:hypothetical protein
MQRAHLPRRRTSKAAYERELVTGDSEASTWGCKPCGRAPKAIVTVFPGRTVTITFTSTSTRYQRLNFTADTGQSGGQASEFEVVSF